MLGERTERENLKETAHRLQAARVDLKALRTFVLPDTIERRLTELINEIEDTEWWTEQAIIARGGIEK